MKKFVRIEALRKEKSFAPRQVADYLKCPEALYAGYERGERAVPAEVVAALADLYDTSADYILGLTDIRERHT